MNLNNHRGKMIFVNFLGESRQIKHVAFLSEMERASLDFWENYLETVLFF